MGAVPPPLLKIGGGQLAPIASTVPASLAATARLVRGRYVTITSGNGRWKFIVFRRTEAKQPDA